MCLVSHPYTHNRNRNSIFDLPAIKPFEDKPWDEYEKKVDSILQKVLKLETPKKEAPKHYFTLTEETYSLGIVLAGFSKENVDLSVTQGIISIKAIKGGVNGDQDLSFKYILPKDGDFKQFSVSLENGILRMSLPRVQPEVFKIELL